MITFRAGKHILSKLELIQVLERADDEFIPNDIGESWFKY